MKILNEGFLDVCIEDDVKQSNKLMDRIWLFPNHHRLFFEIIPVTAWSCCNKGYFKLFAAEAGRCRVSTFYEVMRVHDAAKKLQRSIIEGEFRNQKRKEKKVYTFFFDGDLEGDVDVDHGGLELRDDVIQF